ATKPADPELRDARILCAAGLVPPIWQLKTRGPPLVTKVGPGEGLLLTATLTAWLCAPGNVTTSGRVSPGGSADGTWTSNSTRPTAPGVRPANLTGASTPPRVSVGMIFAWASGFAGLVAPLPGKMVRSPMPVP